MNETLQTIFARRSTKKYLPKPVEQEKLELILKAGTYAASGMGRQSPKIVVLQKKEDIEELEQLNAAILGNPAAKPFYGAPVVCVVLANADWFTSVEDGSLVIGNMLLAAESLGVGACWIHRAKEEFASEEGKHLLRKWGVEGNYIGVGHCILGYTDGARKQAAPRKDDYIVYI